MILDGFYFSALITKNGTEYIELNLMVIDNDIKYCYSTKLENISNTDNIKDMNKQQLSSALKKISYNIEKNIRNQYRE